MRRASCLLASLLLLASVPSVRAADLTLVVGFAAGGTSSSAARAILEPFARISGRRVIVENKPGAGGLIAAQYVASHAPESGLLFFMSSSSSLRIPTDMGLVPIARIAVYDYVVVKRGPAEGGLPAHIEAARHDKKLQLYATPGAGSTSHLSLARLFRDADVPMLHVPYQGGAPAITALLGGHVALAGVPYPDFLPFEEKLVVVARTGNGLTVGGWMGVYAPPGTSPAEVARLAAWLQAASEESAGLLAKIGFRAAFAPAKEFAARHEADREMFLPELELQGVRF